MRILFKKLKEKTGGFTLLEMVLALVIMSIITVTLAPLFRNSVNMYMYTAAIADSGQCARIAFNRLLMDMREIQTMNYGGTTYINFVDIDGDTRSYTVSESNLYLNGQLAADNLQSLNFEYMDINGVTCSATDPDIWQIRMTMNFDIMGTTHTYSADIQPRNWQSL